jgi:hypothetical protein
LVEVVTHVVENVEEVVGMVVTLHTVVAVMMCVHGRDLRVMV